MNAVARVFVPCDSAAVAAGADDVAASLQPECARRGLAVRIVRNSSRGLFWLEPLVEVDTARGRIAYGPVAVEDVAGLLDAGLLQGGAHPLCHGPDRGDPLPAPPGAADLRPDGRDRSALARRLRGARGLCRPARRARSWTARHRATRCCDSGLRGRGGAAFPAGIKWKTVAAAQAPQKYIVCNADEGDSGTFSDRMVMEGDPFMLIEGMAIAGLATGATRGYVYVRSEYPQAVATMREAVVLARASGLLGPHFELEIRKAAGSYVCGEETAMLESLEGRRGIVRAKPPVPALAGLFGQPSVINNVLTFASVPVILARGAEFYKDFGMGRSRGTLPFQLAGNVKHGGLVEKAFGITLRQLMFDYGGGTASGRPLKAVQVGGPLGTYVPESLWDAPLDYETYAAASAVVGHGGIVMHDDTADMARLARYAMEFCAIESCGKCTPCRIGSTRGVEVVDRLMAADEQTRPQQLKLLRDLCDTMLHGSLCAMGGMTPFPVLSALDHYPEDFGLANPGRQAA